jgi:alkanesulfonate monooxygenase SsuD/methylene tetrahydromethanopterin reductase-like flavin-dependent oxidoreductase (luciferase family)
VSLLGGVTVVEQVAPGRLRLGVGTSHQVPMRDLLGIPWERPLTHLREYLQVLRPLLHEGRVDFDGEFYRVHFGIADPPQTPLFISALRPNAWALAGELTEGGIAWLCPPSYLLGSAKPALVKAAEAAGRPAPAVIAHSQAVVTPDRDAARAAVASRIKASGYTSLPNYLEMFATAGFPTEPGGEVSDELVDALTISGSDDQIATRISDLLASGLDELLITQVPLDDAAAEERRLLEILAEM